VAIDPFNTLYARTYGYGIFRSTDGGVLEPTGSPGFAGSLAIDPKIPLPYMRERRQRRRVFKSMDAGALDRDELRLRATSPIDIAVDPQNPNTVYRH
jgi:hypothetical protein